ncbi:MAG TPA: hypothetical protein VI861_01140 [Rickettsiales bacterium]|nr:hypothetical protein [Rickettsiales bacterium]
MLNIFNIEIAGFARVIPLFDVMMIFYFTVFLPVFGLWFIFLLGIWADALNGNPLGMTSLIYIFLIKFFTILNQKMVIRDEFRQLWQQFVIFCACFLFLKWSFLSLFNGAIYSLITIFVQLILSAVFYVIMHKFFDFLNRKLIEER